MQYVTIPKAEDLAKCEMEEPIKAQMQMNRESSQSQLEPFFEQYCIVTKWVTLSLNELGSPVSTSFHF